jgi:xylulokinase
VDGVFVGLDLGTSSLKAVAVDASGLVLARARAAYPTYRPEPGAAEQEPADWLVAVADVVAALVAQVPASGWAGIGLSAMIPTLVLADGPGEPRGRAVTWQDGRAQAFGDELRGSFGGDALYELTGQWVDGRYLLPMAMQARARDGGAGSARWLLGAKDLLFSWLTGEVATDPSTAAGYGCYDLAAGAWSPDVAAAARTGIRVGGGRPPAAPSSWLLPPVRPSTTARPLLAERAAALGLPAELPVVLGAADSVLGAYGLGVTEPGDVAYLAGTSTVVLGVSPELVRDHRHRFLVTPLAVGAGWGLEMDLLSTGSAISWLQALLGGGSGSEPANLLALADSVDPATVGLPTFLPYLAPGEQGALWDPDLTGTLVGLDLGHGRAELARALVNGILVESRRCLSVLETASGRAGRVRMAGHTTAGRFAADLADATGRMVSRTDGAEASALGAALLARLALTYVPPGEPADAVTAVPAPTRAAAWAAIGDRHDAVLRTFRESSREGAP